MTLCDAVKIGTHLSEDQLAEFIINAAKEVLSTMAMMDIADNYPLREPITTFHCSVTGMVGLAGIYTGVISIHCPKSLALKITGNMLGMEPEECADDINDALGEIANMLAGHVKQVLSKGGMDINLSIPTVIAGEEYTVTSMTQSDTVVIPFAWEGDRFLVGLVLRREG